MPSRNFLIAALDPISRDLLHPILRHVDLPQQRVLFEAGDQVSSVYFPFDAVISLVVSLSTGETIEAAMVGRDGVIGASAALDGKVSLSRGIVQIGGAGMMCDSDILKGLAMKSPALHSILIRHEQVVYAQAQQSAACNVTHHLEARLARWLLRARDLSGADRLPFTQQFLAEMLGVGRTSVSVTAHTLQQAGLIKYSRGNIQITNLDGLGEAACECYGTIRGHYNLLLGRGP